MLAKSFKKRSKPLNGKLFHQSTNQFVHNKGDGVTYRLPDDDQKRILRKDRRQGIISARQQRKTLKEMRKFNKEFSGQNHKNTKVNQYGYF